MLLQGPKEKLRIYLLSILRHNFTNSIIEILDIEFDNNGENILKNSPLIQYLNIKTKAANRGSKSRSGFANHYALYVLIEDYLANEFHVQGNYSKYIGAQYSNLLKRQRELPFGSKLQNHALNHRLNQEFKKYFPSFDYFPILRDPESNRYWINEGLLKVGINEASYDISNAVLKIIQRYVSARMQSFNSFMSECAELIKIQDNEPAKATEFIRGLLRPNVDARIFEIVSYAILKQYYSEKAIYWGWSQDNLNKEFLALYKTGRTNANDGGIDFVMKPLGRFFQVTETIEAGKYFLDIDKVQRYPMTFVVKTTETADEVIKKIKDQARQKFSVEKIVDRYISCVEEIINTTRLIQIFDKTIVDGYIENVIKEIVLQSRIEFNVEEENTSTVGFGGK